MVSDELSVEVDLHGRTVMLQVADEAQTALLRVVLRVRQSKPVEMKIPDQQNTSGNGKIH